MPELQNDNEEFELDATHYYKEKVHINVNDMNDLKSTLSQFGYDIDDRIERREVVNIYRLVETEMEKEIANLAHHGHYSAAKLMRQRLTSLRAEFDEVLVHGEKIARHDQLKLFEDAKHKHYSILNQSHKHLESHDDQTIKETLQVPLLWKTANKLS